MSEKVLRIVGDCQHGISQNSNPNFENWLDSQEYLAFYRLEVYNGKLTAEASLLSWRVNKPFVTANSNL